MCSIHNRLNKKLGWALAAGAATFSIGCTSINQKPTRPELSQAPLIIDPAMQARDWDRSVASYPSGAVPAWNTRFKYQLRPDTPAYIAPVAAPVVFLGQTAFLPITLITARPFTPVIYRGVQEPASSNAFPAPPDLTLSQQAKSPQSTGGTSSGGASSGGASNSASPGTSGGAYGTAPGGH